MRQQDISAMQRGKRPISATTVGLLCEALSIYGPEASELAMQALIDAAPPEKQGVLRRAFFVSWAIGATFGLVAATTNDAARSTMARGQTPPETAARESAESNRRAETANSQVYESILDKTGLYIVVLNIMG